MAVYYVNGTSNAGATYGLNGYYYPLYLTAAEARDSSGNTSGTFHSHNFYEFPGKTFYMPTTGATHAATSAPTGSYGGETYTQFTQSGTGGIPYQPTPSSANGFISFSIPTCTGGYSTKPFRDHGDKITNVYYHEMKVLTVSYTPLDDDDTMTAATHKPLRSPFPDDAEAFYVGDQSVSNGGDGLTTFTRVFANIPNTRYDPTGLYAFDFSGVTTSSDGTVTEVIDYAMNITGQGYNGKYTAYGNIHPGQPNYYFGESLGRRNIIIGTVSDSTGLAVGDTIVVAFNTPIQVTSSYSSQVINYSTLSVTIIKIVANAITFGFGGIRYQNEYEWQWAQEASSLQFSKTVVTDTVTTTQGEIQTKNSPSRELKSYIKTTQPTTEILQNMTQLPQSLTTTSTPTIAQYNAMVAAGEYLNGAPETITRFMGNIYEKSLIQVRAIS